MSKSDSSAPVAGAQPTLWVRLQPWLSTVFRLGLAVVFIWAALPKLTNLTQSRLAVGAYDLLPPTLVSIVAVALPIVELTVALLLLAGLLTRPAAALFALMMLVFIAGISSAWARGILIDCGCFGGGGALPDGAEAPYAWEIARDAGLAAVAVFLVFWPRSRFSADRAAGLIAERKD